MPDPAQQLKLVNKYRPAEALSEEQWDVAVYTTLDRATLLKRLLRSAASPTSTAASTTSTPTPTSSPSAAARGNTFRSGSGRAGAAPSPHVFDGPAAALVPRDRLGQMFLDATRRQCSGPQEAGAGSSAAAGPGGSSDSSTSSSAVVHYPLDARHTECLLTEEGRQDVAMQLTEALRAILPQL